MLSKPQLEQVKDLLAELHSFAALIDKIDHEHSKPVPDDVELQRLLEELSKGLDVAFDLTQRLNKTALALHIELLARKPRNP